jgi:hypothetical protein
LSQDHHRSISYSQKENNWWKDQCMEWHIYIYVTCKRLILFFWNYRKLDRYRSWNSRIILSHSSSTRHTISQKQSYGFRFIVPSIPPISNGNFCQHPWKLVHSSNDGHLTCTCCLYFSLYTELQECISPLTVVTLMSKSDDSICYDGYDLNHKTETIALFLRDSVSCRRTGTMQTIYFGCIACISAMSTWHSAFHQKVDRNFYYIGKTTSGPFLTHRQRIIVENINVWNGRGMFMLLAND